MKPFFKWKTSFDLKDFVATGAGAAKSYVPQRAKAGSSAQKAPAGGRYSSAKTEATSSARGASGPGAVVKGFGSRPSEDNAAGVISELKRPRGVGKRL